MRKVTKIITKFLATTPKSYSYCLKKDDHETEDSEFISAEFI